MGSIHRAMVLLGSALALPLGLVACSSSTGAMGCPSNSKITVTGGTISLAPLPGQAQVLHTPLSPASESSNGAVQLPISGGSFNNSSYAGSINTKGGANAYGPSGKLVSFTNFTINTQNGVVTAQVNGQPVQLLQIAGGSDAYRSFIRQTLSTISNSSNRINYPPLPVTQAAVAAGVLDQDLAVGNFTPGLQVGTLASTVSYKC